MFNQVSRKTRWETEGEVKLEGNIFPKFMKDTNLQFKKHESIPKLNIQLGVTITNPKIEGWK